MCRPTPRPKHAPSSMVGPWVQGGWRVRRGWGHRPRQRHRRYLGSWAPTAAQGRELAGRSWADPPVHPARQGPTMTSRRRGRRRGGEIRSGRGGRRSTGRRGTCLGNGVRRGRRGICWRRTASSASAVGEGLLETRTLSLSAAQTGECVSGLGPDCWRQSKTSHDFYMTTNKVLMHCYIDSLHRHKLCSIHTMP